MKRSAVYCFALTLFACRTAPPATPSRAQEPLLSPTGTARYTHFAVASDHPEASRAGAEVLRSGGTAADGAAAAMLALGVASPASSGLGGGGFALYYRASDRSLTFIDFRETAPEALTPERITRFSPGGPPRAMGPTVGVPGEPRGIEALLQRFGRLGLSRVVEPAVRLAEEGFTPSERTEELSERFIEVLRRDPVGRSYLSGPDGGMITGARIRNPALAETLRAFGREGARYFYEGPVAQEIVHAVGSMGGVMTTADLAGYRIAVREPLVGDHFGYRWVSAPPESAGGYTLMASLALMERWAPHSEVDVIHALAESWRGPFIDRARYFGDPDFVRVPVERLLAPERVAARARVFDNDHARPSSEYDLPLPEAPAAVDVPVGAGTSHLCVVDAEGNIASITTTVNIPFGAGVSVRGFWLNDEMDDFSVLPPQSATGPAASTTNLAHGRRRPVSTMTPSIVFQGDRPVLCVGGSGGTRIVTAVTQAAYRALVLHTPLGEAIAHPRVHHAAEPDSLGVERDVPANVLDALRARGHTIVPLRYAAVVQAIEIARNANGVSLVAVSDPRKGGHPAGR